jgi:hypothetical protein
MKKDQPALQLSLSRITPSGLEWNTNRERERKKIGLDITAGLTVWVERQRQRQTVLG